MQVNKPIDEYPVNIEKTLRLVSKLLFGDQPSVVNHFVSFGKPLKEKFGIMNLKLNWFLSHLMEFKQYQMELPILSCRENMASNWEYDYIWPFST